LPTWLLYWIRRVRAHTHTHTLTHTHIHSHTHNLTHTHKLTLTTHTRTRTHACADLSSLTQFGAPYVGHIYLYFYTQSHIHTHTHTRMQDADLVQEGLMQRGLTAFQTGMDNVRNLTGSPIAGLDPHELIDVRPLLQVRVCACV